MPRNDDTRRTARERSQARMGRYDGYSGSAARSSTDSYGRARQDSAHLSQTRYSRQAPREASMSSRSLERQRRSERQTDWRADRQPEGRAPSRADASRNERLQRSSRAGREERAKRAGGIAQPTRSGRAARQQGYRDQRGGGRQARQAGARRTARPQAAQAGGFKGFLAGLPSAYVRIGGAVLAAIVLLVVVFAVLVPSCTDTPQEPQAASSESAASAQQGLVAEIGKVKTAKQAEVETANQVGSLETSNTSVEALVSLLGEEETAKLVAQAKTNPDALWIAAHPGAYAFDGIEVQYKILKLAADEPAAIPYVRDFPAKYPMSDAVTDKDLAMDVASPSDAVPNTSVPHLYQWDRRWAYTVYSSTTFGLTGCGPTSLAMVYQGLNRTVDRTPHDMAVLAEERGYMSEYNGTDSAMFVNLAPELGLNCWESYPDAANIREELSQGHVIIANLGPGFFTTNGHFFVLAGLADNGQVIVNDPYSVARSSQTWDADFIATETMAMFVYSKA